MVADACHFDAGQVGVLADGPVDVLLRDCTLASADPAFWFDNGAGAGPVVADLWLHHVSILAGEGPVFRFEGTAPRVCGGGFGHRPAARQQRHPGGDR